MTREQALDIAKKNHAARQTADIENLFRGGPEVDNAAFGYRHGWYIVGEYSFNNEEVTGTPSSNHCPVQRAFAYL